jgi:flagellar hook assembly protein FlgD
MRRSAAVAAAVALLASGVALATPAGAAALKPGPVTGITVTANNTGGVTVSWKAPVVKKGKTVKATSYTVACGSAKKLTVKTTRANVVGVVKSGYKDNVQCAISALAGKALGSAAKSKLFTAYVQIGTATFNLTPAAMGKTGLNGALVPVTPAHLSVNTQDGSAVMTFPIVARNATTHDITLAGGFAAGNQAPQPVTTIVVKTDTVDNTKLDVWGFVPALALTPHPTKVLLVLSNVVAGQSANSASFDVSYTSNIADISLFTALGINLTAGQALGTGTFQ